MGAASSPHGEPTAPAFYICPSSLRPLKGVLAMSVFSIKNNPFDDSYAERWKGAGKRAEEAVVTATEAATEVLQSEVVFRGDRSGMKGELLDAVQPVGAGRVGIPSTSPLSEEAFQEEYGTLEKRPKGVMRSAERAARAEAEAVFSEVLEAELLG